VIKYSTIILSLKMQGGSRNPNPSGATSFKDAFKGKVATQVYQSQNMLGPYIVEEMDKLPEMDIKIP